MNRIDVRLLRVLLQAGSELSLEELASQTHLPAEVVIQRIDALTSEGFDIARHPMRGIQLHSTPSRLVPEDIAARISPENRLAKDILVFQETGSTNDVCTRLGVDNAPEGTVVFAESQSAGRGRLGRVWSSMSGEGLWFSVLVRPEWPMMDWTRLTLCAALAVRNSVAETTGLNPLIKWPNDIFLHGRKLAGILLESRVGNANSGFVVIGIGLNVGQHSFPEQLESIATSLQIEAGKAIHRADLAAKILTNLDTFHQDAPENFGGILHSCSAHSLTLGEPVHLQTGNELIDGIAEEFSPSGGLIVRMNNGSLRTIDSGEILMPAKVHNSL